MKVTLFATPWKNMERAAAEEATALLVLAIALDGYKVHFDRFSIGTSGDHPFGSWQNNGDFLSLRLEGTSDYERLRFKEHGWIDGDVLVLPVTELEIIHAEALVPA